MDQPLSTRAGPRANDALVLAFLAPMFGYRAVPHPGFGFLALCPCGCGAANPLGREPGPAIVNLLVLAAAKGRGAVA